jgi:hypothetical protein
MPGVGGPCIDRTCPDWRPGGGHAHVAAEISEEELAQAEERVRRLLVLPTREELRERGPAWEAGWVAGCHAEAAYRDAGLSKAAKSVRATLEALAERRPDAAAHDLTLILFSIFVEGWWRKSRLELRVMDLRRRLRRVFS